MKRSETGAALPLALMVLLVISAVGFALASMGMTEVAIGTNWKAHTTAFYAAEAGLESGVVALRSQLAQTPTPQVDQNNNVVMGIPLYFNESYESYWLAHPPAVGISRIAPSYTTTFTTGPRAGLFGIVTDYQIAAQATGEKGTQASLTQTLKHIQIPLFQFGVFYGRGVDLEIAPGPLMTFNGRVHSNSNLYLVANSGLDFTSYITTAGNIYRKLKRDGSPVRGNSPRIKDANNNWQYLNFDHEYQPGFSSLWASAQDWKTHAESVYGPSGKESTVKDSTMGVGQIIPPVPDLFYNPSNPDVVAHQMIEKGTGSDSAEMQQAKLYYKADIRIVDGVATNKNGTLVNCPAGAVTTASFHDRREQANMTVTQVNVSALGACTPANGILYVSQSGANTGIRLTDGSQLPSGGLTVVSENPVYIKGDYNNVNKQPAAVLADAITVLSNNWGPNNSDHKSDPADPDHLCSSGSCKTSDRPATSTTVNAAFALGPSAESAVNQGNGQLENVIRFLENWSGDTLTYQGSIIALWHSQRATGAWRCCGSTGTNYYDAPNRNWSYDIMFNTTPPPGTPMGVIMTRGQWTQAQQ